MAVQWTERFWTTLLSGNTRQTGKAATFTLRIVRSSDGYMLDWSDWTFKTSGWTTLNQAATEHDATNNPGVYYWTIGTSSTVDHTLPACFNDDEYLFELYESSLPYNQSCSQLVRKRRMTSMLFVQVVLNKRALANGGSANYIIYEDDNSTALVTKSVTDKDGGAISLPTGIPARED